MRLKRFPFPCNRFPEKNSPFFSAASSGENMMELWRDVHSFKVSIGAMAVGQDALSTFLQSGGAFGGIIGANAGLSSVQSSFSQAGSSVTGETRRIITSKKYSPTSYLQKPLNDPPIYTDEVPEPRTGNLPSVTVCGEYPVHSLRDAAGQALLTIDFGRSVNLGGIYAPFILIQFSNNIGNSRGAFLSGFINFADSGVIPIYADVPSVVGGAIRPEQRYSQLLFDKTTVSAKNGTDTLIIGPAGGKMFNGFTNLKQVFMGNAEATFKVPASETGNLSITVPKGATSGRVLFIEKRDGTSESINKFYSSEKIIVV